MTIVQGSPEWFLQRLGKVTASRLSDVLAKIKSGESATRANYRAELVAERLTGKSADAWLGLRRDPFAESRHAPKSLLAPATRLPAQPRRCGRR